MEKNNFKLKGTYLTTTKKFLEKEFGKDYANQIFSKYYPGIVVLSSSWYSASPLIQMLYDCAAGKNINFREFMIKSTTFTLETDLNGVYKFFMKLGGIKRIIDALPQLGNSYSNWIDLKVTGNIDKQVLLDIMIPSQYEEYFINGHEGALSGILNVCGKRLLAYTKLNRQIIMKDGNEFSKLNVEVRYE